MPVVRLWRPGDPLDALRTLVDVGGVLAIPTESSYGLACDPRHAGGVEAIYRLKTRDRGKPLPVVAADLDQLGMLGIDTGSPAVVAASSLWPGAFSAVVPFAPELAWPAAADGATLAVRVPAHGGLRDLLSGLGSPLTATSANAAGDPPLLEPEELARWLRGSAVPVTLVDGGVLPGGPPSTLAAPEPDGWRVIRPGRIPEDQLPPLRAKAPEP
ncbi:MAG: L-threonylcarbamoyladenylate synthase [Acidobacteriota bacterium]